MCFVSRFCTGLTLLTCAFLLSSCGKYVPTFYRLDVRQGNIIEQERVERLRLGMSRRQVEALLGTPPITDPFNVVRWDYIYVFFPRGNPKKGSQRHLALFFSGDSLVQIDGDTEGLDLGSLPEDFAADDSGLAEPTFDEPNLDEIVPSDAAPDNNGEPQGQGPDGEEQLSF